jgi:hypothetical protein
MSACLQAGLKSFEKVYVVHVVHVVSGRIV